MKPDPPILAAGDELISKLGIGCIPLCPHDHSGPIPAKHLEECKDPLKFGKVPLYPWKEYMEHRPSLHAFRALFFRNPNCNLGVPLGPVSRLSRIDSDGPDAERLLHEIARAAGQEIPHTWQFQSGGGGTGRIFGLAEGEDPPTWAISLPDGELRHQGKGAQTAWPPSIHANGQPYVWLTDCAPGQVDLAPLPACLATKPVVKPPPPVNRLPPAFTAPAAVLDDARRYLAKMGPCDPRPEAAMDASTHLLKAANALVIGFGFDDDTALGLLAEWDAGNPAGAYPEKEYRRKVAAAHAAPNYPPKYPARMGYLLSTRQPLHGPNGDQPAGGHANGEGLPGGGNGANGNGHTQPGAKPKPRKPLVGYNAADLMATDFGQLRWAVPGIIPEGASLLVGRPKIGKSWLVLGVCLGVARGGPILGKITADQGEVLYLALEDGFRRLKHRLGKILDRQGGKPPPALHFYTEWPSPAAGGILEIEEWLKEHPGTRLIIVDTLQCMRELKGDSGKLYAEDYAAIREFRTLAQKYGVAVVLVHHTRKAARGETGGEQDPLEEVSGTMGLTGAADTILVLKRPRYGSAGKLFVTGRDIVEGEDELHLAYDKEFCHWELRDGPPPPEPKKLSKDEQGVVQALTIAGRPLALGEILLALHAEESDKERLTRMVRRLAADNGPLRKQGYGRYELRPLSDLSDCPTDGTS